MRFQALNLYPSFRIGFAGLGGFERCLGLAFRRVELDHDVGIVAGAFDQVEDFTMSTLPSPSGQ